MFHVFIEVLLSFSISLYLEVITPEVLYYHMIIRMCKLENYLYSDFDIGRTVLMRLVWIVEIVNESALCMWLLCVCVSVFLSMSVNVCMFVCVCECVCVEVCVFEYV